MVDLFVVVAFREQTEKLLAQVRDVERDEALGQKRHVPTLVRHLYVLSKFFRLRDLFRDHEAIDSCPTPVIFHVPYGLEDRDTGVEQLLLRYRGRIPIVVRSYDPHSPRKMSRDYLLAHHDLVLTYNRPLVDADRLRYSRIAYDNHLVEVRQPNPHPQAFASMVLANKKPRQGEQEAGFGIFDHREQAIENLYALRDDLSQFESIDVFGRGWDTTRPNHHDTVHPFSAKYDVTQRYRFSLAVENCSMTTYISEKILDAFLSGTVPVYFGAPDAADEIPEDTFVAARDYDSLGELVHALQHMPSEQRLLRVHAILRERHSVFDRFSTFRNYVQPIYQWLHEKGTALRVPDDDDANLLKKSMDALRLAEEGPPGGLRRLRAKARRAMKARRWR